MNHPINVVSYAQLALKSLFIFRPGQPMRMCRFKRDLRTRRHPISNRQIETNPRPILFSLAIIP